MKGLGERGATYEDGLALGRKSWVFFSLFQDGKIRDKFATVLVPKRYRGASKEVMFILDI